MRHRIIHRPGHHRGGWSFTFLTAVEFLRSGWPTWIKQITVNSRKSATTLMPQHPIPPGHPMETTWRGFQLKMGYPACIYGTGYILRTYRGLLAVEIGPCGVQ